MCICWGEKPNKTIKKQKAKNKRKQNQANTQKRKKNDAIRGFGISFTFLGIGSYDITWGCCWYVGEDVYLGYDLSLWLLAPQIPNCLFPLCLYPFAPFQPLKVLMIALCVLHYSGSELESLIKLMIDLVLWNEIWENHILL